MSRGQVSWLSGWKATLLAWLLPAVVSPHVMLCALRCAVLAAGTSSSLKVWSLTKDSG
jgi:hypothetical protein